MEAPKVVDITRLNTLTQTGSNKISDRQSTGQTTADSASGQILNKAPELDSVQLTPQAKQLGGVQEKMSTLSDIDHQKVAEIKTAIAEGNYKIDPDILAENIIKFETELAKLPQ